MAWTKQDLKWNAVDPNKLTGAALKAYKEAVAALELAQKKVNDAKPLIEQAFDGKTFPKVPAGKVARISLRLNYDGSPSLKAAAAEPNKGKSESEAFSW